MTHTISSFNHKCKGCKVTITWDNDKKKLSVKRRVSDKMCSDCVSKLDQFNRDDL